MPRLWPALRQRLRTAYKVCTLRVLSSANRDINNSTCVAERAQCPPVCVSIERVPGLFSGSCWRGGQQITLVQPLFISHVHLEQKGIFSFI